MPLHYHKTGPHASLSLDGRLTARCDTCGATLDASARIGVVESGGSCAMVCARCWPDYRAAHPGAPGALWCPLKSALEHFAASLR